jgi:hypothetical protein
MHPDDRPSSTPPEPPYRQITQTDPSLAHTESAREQTDRHANTAYRLARHHARLFGRPPNASERDDEGEGVLGDVAMLTRRVGRPADPNLERPASGLIGASADLRTMLTQLTTDLLADRTSREKLRKTVFWVGLAIFAAFLEEGGRHLFHYLVRA